MSLATKTLTQGRLALKSLLNVPGFVTSVVLTMSLTMATLFVVMSLVNTYFFRPLDVLDEPNLYVVEQEVETPTGVHSGFQSYKTIIQWLRTQSSFEKITPVSPSQMVVRNLPGEPKVLATFATADYFELLNVPVILGQALPSDVPFDQPSNGVLISEDLWKRYFDRDPNVLSKQLQYDDKFFSIIGVVSSTFEVPYMFYQGRSDAWFHFGNDPRYFNDGEFDNPWDNTYRSLKIIGQAGAGTDQQQIYNDLDARIEDVRNEWIEGYEFATDLRPLVIPYRIAELGDKGHLSLFLLAGTLGLLLIAVVNVCNLFFSRALVQHKTLALQAILGAKRKLLFMSIFAQTMILMTVSLLLSLFVAAWGIELFKYLALGKLPLVKSISIDLHLLLVAAGLSLLLAWLFARITSGLVNYNSLGAQQQSSGKGSVTQISATMVRVLVGVQMMLASVLIIFSALALTKTHDTLTRPMGSNYQNLHSLVGFITDENQNLPESERFDKQERVRQFIESQPQVKRVSIGFSPVSERISRSTLTDLAGNQSQFTPQSWVGVDFFDHTGTRIIEGRTFSQEAVRGTKKEMLVSQTMAMMLEENGDVIGKVYAGVEDEMEVVGITEDFNHPGFYHQDKGAHIWWPSRARGYPFVIEFNPGQTMDQEHILNALREQDSRFQLWQYLSLEQEYDKIIYMDIITLNLSYILGIFTLLLASVGIYGVLSYNLGMRRFEFGLRMALGAKRKRLYGLLVKDAVAPLVSGLLMAILATLLLYQFFGHVLSNWLTFDPGLMLVAVIFTTVVAGIASFRPMQKIIISRPMAALRNE